MSGSIALRVQNFDAPEQALVLARLCEARGEDGGEFGAGDLGNLYLALGIPGPSKNSNALRSLSTREWVRPGSGRHRWKLTPTGRATAEDLLSRMDYAVLEAEAIGSHGSSLGRAIHSVVPPELAPPSLLRALKRFLDDHPFETNVFGMTRFPDDEIPDPVTGALEVVKESCGLHGLEFHLASDRAIDDDLWTNVAAHMWASHYGIAFFENRVGRGLNYNLTIEVGSMLMTGRRCALLKDASMAGMPTDLVGRIYKPVDLDNEDSVREAVHTWIREDLGLPGCPQCSKAR